MSTHAKLLIQANGEKPKLLTISAEKPVKIAIDNQDKIILKNIQNDFAPENITLKRDGDNLNVFLEGDDNAALVIKDYFQLISPPKLLGMAEDHQLYQYQLTQVANNGTSYSFSAGQLEPAALGGQSQGNGDSMFAAAEEPDSGALAALPWFLGALGAAAVGGIVAIAHHNHGGHHNLGGHDNVAAKAALPTVGSTTHIVDGKQVPLTAGSNISDGLPTFNGRADAGATIHIYDNGKEIGTTTSDANGDWNFTPSAPLPNGDNSITFSQETTSGSTSDQTAGFDFTVDTSTPDAPKLSEVHDAVGDSQGAIANGATTDDNNPKLTGTGIPNGMVHVYINDVMVGDAKVDATGQWSYQSPTALADGHYKITLTQTNLAGTTSQISPSFDFDVSTAANGNRSNDSNNGNSPDQPTITDVVDKAHADVAVNDHGTTNVNEMTFRGKAQAGAEVTLKDGDKTVLGTTTADQDGNWTFTPSVALADGEHNVTATATTSAGSSSPSAGFDFTVDTQAPGKPSIGGVVETGHPDQAIADHSSTKTPDVTFSGKAEANSTVVLTDSNGEEVGRGKADADGNWHIDTQLADGAHDITATATDAAGNVSPASNGYEVTVDSSAPVDPNKDKPAAPTITDVVDKAHPDVAVNDHRTTNVNEMTFRGKAQAGAEVTLKDGDKTVLGTTTADQDGNWTFTPSVALADGEHNVTATATTAAGSSSPSAGFDFTVDTQAPGKPSIGGVVETGHPDQAIADHSSTKTPDVTFSGKAEANSTVVLTDSNGEEVGRGKADADGNWHIDTQLADGAHDITATATDAAGNVSPASNGFEVTVDSSAPVDPNKDKPAAPTITDVVDKAHADVAVKDHGTTNVNEMTFSGTSHAGAQITLKDGDKVLGTTTANDQGNWTFTPSVALADGAHNVTATATTAAGSSSPSAGFDFTVDTQAPGKPSIDGVTETGHPDKAIADHATATTSEVTFNGHAEANSTVVLKDSNGKEVGRGEANSKGEWAIGVTLENGTHDITAQAIDKAENISAASSPYDLTVDTSASTDPDSGKPTAPVITDVVDKAHTDVTIKEHDTTKANELTFKGTSAAGAQITLKDGDKVLGTTTANAQGNWSFTPNVAFSDGPHDVTATASNSAGSSLPSAGYDFTVDTQAPAKPTIDEVIETGHPDHAIADHATTTTSEVTFKGHAEANNTVVLKNSDGKEVGRGTADANGNWSVNTTLQNGTYDITATSSDAAGNTSPVSESFDVTVDTSANVDPDAGKPAAPTITDVVDKAHPDVAVNDHRTTNVNEMTFRGKAQAGAEVTLKDGDKTVLGTTTADQDGNWTFTPSVALADGEHNVTATATTAAGSSSPSAGFDFTVDTQAPGKPSIGGVVETGHPDQAIADHSSTKTPDVTFSGKAEANSTVVLTDSNGEEVGRGKADADGNWHIDTQLADGAHDITATATDAAGNVSPASNGFEVTVDSSAPVDPNKDKPAAPTITDVVDKAHADVAVKDHGTTNVNEMTFSGTSHAGAQITLKDGDKVLGTTTANDQGNWTFTPSVALADGTHNVTATATTAAGSSSPSAGFDFTVDTQAPGKPSIDGVTETGHPDKAIADHATATTSEVTFNGHAEANSTVVLKDSNGKEVGRGEANSKGEWAIGVTLENGTHDITAQAIDKAENISAASSPYDLTVDTSASTDPDSGKPTAPVITDVVDKAHTDVTIKEHDTTKANELTFKGTSAAGAQITLKDGDKVLGTTTANAQGNWSFTPNVAFSDGPHDVTATASNSAGSSLPSAGYDFTVDTQAPAKPTIDEVIETGHPDHAIADHATTTTSEVTFKGHAEANNTVVLKNSDGKEVGRGTADANGNWSVNTTLQNGTYDITATSSDAAGNTSPVSESFDVTVDTSANVDPDAGKPAAPTITDVVDKAHPDVAVNDHRTTNVNEMTFRGKAQAGAEVTLKDGDKTVLGTTTADQDGNWTFTPSVALADGEHNVTATATTAAGSSSPSAGFDFTVDTQAPGKPSIGGVVETGHPDQAIADHSSTKTPDVTFSGKAEANSTVVLTDSNGEEVGRGKADADGNWHIDTQLADGAHDITATATDAAGNVSPASNGFEVTVDSSAPVDPNKDKPAAPTITDVVDKAHADVAVKDHGTTNVNEMTFSGTSHAGAQITLKDGDKVLGTTTANDQGNWTFTPSVALADGAHNVTATATTAAGSSSPSAGFDFTVDTQAPGKPSIDGVTETGHPDKAIADHATATTSEVTFNGHAEANSTVVLKDSNGKEVGRGEANSKGEWAIGVTLENGTHDITAQAIDKAENISAASSPYDLTVDTSASTDPDSGKPTAPVITDVVDKAHTDVTIKEHDTTKANELTFKGTSAAGAQITLKDGDKVLGTTTANAQGNWSFTPNVAFSDGPHDVTATASNSAGSSLPSAGYDFTVDTQAPAKPTIDEVIETGHPDHAIADHATTTTSEVTFKGHAEANNTVVLKNSDGKEVGRGTADANGNWSVNTTLQNGTYDITATSSDAAGNTSPVSESFDVTVDTSANVDPDAGKPAAPTITDVVDKAHPDVAVNDHRTTNVNEMTFRGKAQAGAEVTLKDGDKTVLGTTTADQDGNWTFTPSVALADGEHNVTATATTAAGSSSPSAGFDFTVDTQAPGKPSIGGVVETGHPDQAIADHSSTKTPDVTFSGKAEANSTVVLTDSNGEEVGRGKADADGNWHIDTQLADGAHDITATATDAAGNVSPASNGFEVTVDSSAPVDPNKDKPAAPTITDVVDKAHADVAVKDHGTTNVNEMTFSGTSHAGAQITLKDGDKVLGTTTANDQGNWTFTPSVALADGAHNVTATATTAAGSSSPSAGFDFTVDTQAPGKPSIDGVTETGHPDKAIADHATATTSEVTFNGHAEANSTVVLKDSNGKEVGRGEANSKGEWAIGVTLENGTHDITAQAIDKAENISAASSPYDLTVDTSASTDPDSGKPTAPVITDVVDKAHTDVTIKEHDTTKANELTFKGTSAAGAQITLKDGDKVLGTTTANAQGNWSFTPNVAFSDGPHDVTATASNSAGSSLPSAGYDFTVDTQAPAKPTIDEVIETGHPDHAIADHATTTTSEVTFKGHAEANNTVVLKNSDGKEVGRGTADANGNWSVNTTLQNGTYDITATSSDAAGNTSPVSESFDVTVDTSANVDPDVGKPAAPTITDVVDKAHPDVEVNDHRTTNVNEMTFRGKAQAGAEVTLKDGDKTVLGTTTADQDGNWTFTPSVALADGEHNVTATATTAAGSSSPSAGFDFTVDTQAPGKPSIGGVVETGHPDQAIADHSSTKTPDVTFSGKAEANSTVVLTDSNGEEVARGKADADGNWHIDTQLADGVHDITATATDAAGNVSPASNGFEVTVDTSANVDPDAGKPAAPTITDVVDKAHADVAVKDHGTTNVNEMTFRGKAQAGAEVTLKDGDKTVLGTTTADQDGNWTLTPSVALADGAHNVTATATTAAGSSSPSAGFDFTVDTQAPGKPSIDGVTETGHPDKAIADHATATTSEVTFNGHAEANSTVVLKDSNGKEVGRGEANSKGEWAIGVTLENGTHDITAQAIDKAENISAASSPYDLTVDTSASTDPDSGKPTAPVITDVVDKAHTDVTIKEHDTTKVNELTFKGTSAAGAQITLKDGDKVLGTTTANAQGNWSFTPNVAFSDGPHDVTATASNSAGSSLPSAGYDFTVDTLAPEKPVINVVLDSTNVTIADHSTTNVDQLTFKGTAEQNSTVTLKDSDGHVLGSDVADDQGNWSITTSGPISEGTHDVTATATDAANNESQKSDPFDFTKTSAVVPPTPTVPDVTQPGQTYTYDGKSTSIGADLSNAGDVNGDGFDDFLLTAPGAEKAFLLYGSANGLPKVPDLSKGLTADQGIEISGGMDGDHNKQGWHVENIGDFDGDGYDDFVVADHYPDKVFVVYGGPNSNNKLDLNAIEKGDNSKGFMITHSDGDSWLGISVAGGDIDGDGYSDLFFGNPEAHNGQGNIYTLYGHEKKTQTNIYIDRSKDSWSEASGQNQWRGSVFNPQSDKDLTTQNGVFGHNLGETMANIGDVNGDGIDDFLFADTLANNHLSPNGFGGTAYVVYGKKGGFGDKFNLDDLTINDGIRINAPFDTWLGGDNGSHSMHNIANIGDINGDGIDDFAIGSPVANHANDAGYTVVIYGKKGGFDHDIDLDFTMKGNNPKGGYNQSSHSLTAKDGFVLFPENYGGKNANKATWSGESIVGIGDINGDGIDDFIVTANGQDDNAGAAYVIYGKEGGLVSGNGVDPIINLKDIATDPTLGYKLQGADGSQFGTNATAGDWNGDGFTDFSIGAQNANGGNGETYIYYAQPKYTQFYTEGNDHIQARVGEHNLLLGGKGDDVITNIGAGINDYANGGDGNDEVHIVSLDFKAVAGGQGIDTLVLDGNNMMLDLMSAKNKVTGFEKFDLGDHTNTLNVGFDDVLRLGEEDLFKHDGSDGKKQLIIDGGDSDKLNLINKGQKWAAQDDQSIDGHTYHTYTAGSNVEILVDSHIQTSIL